ncbi:MAG: hypothetical protein RL685_4285 [Pseudomonadota bacterium]
MLRCLRIRNLAIIDELELELGPGLNVLTGETGAGKSILVSALELVLGGRARGDVVRGGAREGEVEALFDLAGDAAVRRRLEGFELLEPDSNGEGGELLVRRVVSAGGRARAFLNGKLVTQQMLAEVAKGLADISSQHEHHTLSDPATHLGYLDAFAGAVPLCQRVSEAYQSLLEAQSALGEFEARLRDRATREAQLAAQIKEIEDLQPEVGEDAELEQACLRLRNMDVLQRLTAEAAEVLYERDDSLVDGLARAGRQIARAAELEPSLGPLSQQLELICSQLEDAARELGRRSGNLRAEPDALQRTEERLHQLARLKRRYGGSLESVLASLDACRAELEELGQHAATSEALAQGRTRAFAQAEGLARALSGQRRQAADRLAGAISGELASLGMGDARVLVELMPAFGDASSSSSSGSSSSGGSSSGGSSSGGSSSSNGASSSSAAGGAVTSKRGELIVDGARLSARGLERAEFLIAPNRGEEARPLHRVASGGELSRAMLAIKCVLADLGPAGMYAFDEVDTGIGGGMAEIIGRKIRSVARHRQVLCITHLAQIAAFADHHFKVEKVVRGERTSSSVRLLTRREQNEEIARMLGGVKITAKTRAVARELLLQARQSAA